MRMIKINFWSDYKSKARTQKINSYHHRFCIYVHSYRMWTFVLLAGNDQALQLIFLLILPLSYNLTAAPNNLAFLLQMRK